jgi:hypothetical protein
MEVPELALARRILNELDLDPAVALAVPLKAPLGRREDAIDDRGFTGGCVGGFGGCMRWSSWAALGLKNPRGGERTGDTITGLTERKSLILSILFIHVQFRPRPFSGEVTESNKK